MKTQEDNRRELPPFPSASSFSAPHLIVQGAVAALRTVAARAGHALRSPDGLLRRFQKPVQHLADGAVFAVERVRVHGDDDCFLRRSTFEHDTAISTFARETDS